jgi:hypothetical protein
LLTQPPILREQCGDSTLSRFVLKPEILHEGPGKSLVRTIERPYPIPYSLAPEDASVPRDVSHDQRSGCRCSEIADSRDSAITLIVEIVERISIAIQWNVKTTEVQ